MRGSIREYVSDRKEPMMDTDFQIVGIRNTEDQIVSRHKKWYQGKPLISALLLAVILSGCLCCHLIMTKDPGYMDLAHYNEAPGGEFLFGTDTMGRDIFSMIWYGGRISLLIGVLATFLSTVLAIVFGAVSGCAPEWVDSLLMRFTEIFLSIPNLLLIIFLQAIMGKATIGSISIVIGLTSWFGIAKIIRTEVRQLRNSEYVIAAKCMGGSFWHILWKHLAPNFVSSIMFMVVMNVRSAIVAESTLSFLGIGLPLDVISWGSMLSLAEKALMSRAWWIVLIPGIFLVVVLMCITSLGHWLQVRVSHQEAKL